MIAANPFGTRLRELRRAAGLTQTQLATKAGLGRSAIARLEAGVHIPSWDTVQALARALGVDCRAFEVSPPAEVDASRKKKGKKK
jgi:transcriptional regulator with XRE-family HTH domain